MRRAVPGRMRARLLAMFAMCGCGGGGGDNPDAPSTIDAPTADSSGVDAACPAGADHPGPYAARITIEGDTAARGWIDPSIEYPDPADFGLMSYTTVPDEAHVHTAIAVSTDHGASWHYQGDVTASTPITIDSSDPAVCGATTCTGTWVHESSSLVLDPTDPDPARRLKVFVHSYFYGAMQWFRLGYMALYTAADPAGPWTETKLFGWDSPSSVSSTGVVYNVQTDPRLAGLNDCFVVAEPGANVRADGTLDLSLSCVRIIGGQSSIEVRLVRSTDHGATWSFVSTLLSPDDAIALGAAHPQINGSDLFYANGAYHLIVTPDGPVSAPGGGGDTFDGYRGCEVIAIDDLDAGTVARCNGAPVVEATYMGEPLRFTGACSAAVGDTVDGMLIPVPDFSTGDPYRVFGAGVPLL